MRMKNLKCLAMVIVSFLCLNTLELQSQDLQGLDVSKMIPLPLNGKSYPSIRIKNDDFIDVQGYDFVFDTGSSALCIPYENLTETFANSIDKSAANTFSKWGKDAYKVTGDLKFYSEDGTEYILAGFEYYVFKEGKAGELPAKKRFIAGAFPYMGSISYELAESHPVNGKIGFGIYSNTPSGNINDDWNSTNLYLQLGPIDQMANYGQIKWRNNITNCRWGNEVYYPEKIPGFKVKLSANNGATTYTSEALEVTLDTGHDILSTRLLGDPQTNGFANDFESSSWHTTEGGKWLKEDVEVEIIFTDSENTENSYTFPSNNTTGLQKIRNGIFVPNAVLISNYDNNKTPLPFQSDATPPVPIPCQPQNRMFLGNSIHFYCPLVFWDITGKRVGVGFKATPLQQNCTTCQEGLTLLKDNMYRYPEKANESNGGRQAWADVFQNFITNNYPACIAVGDYVKANPTAAINTIYTESTVGNWDQLFQSHVGILTHGTRIPAYCPYAHRGQYDCLEASRRMLEFSIPAVERIIDEVE